MTHPMQLPVMNAQGVGFIGPSVPVEMAALTDLSGAANMKLANIMPNAGHTYWRMIMSAVNIFSDLVGG